MYALSHLRLWPTFRLCAPMVAHGRGCIGSIVAVRGWERAPRHGTQEAHQEAHISSMSFLAEDELLRRITSEVWQRLSRGGGLMRQEAHHDSYIPSMSILA